MNVRYKIRTKRDKNVQLGTVYTRGQVQTKFPIHYVRYKNFGTSGTDQKRYNNINVFVKKKLLSFEKRIKRKKKSKIKQTCCIYGKIIFTYLFGTCSLQPCPCVAFWEVEPAYLRARPFSWAGCQSYWKA